MKNILALGTILFLLISIGIIVVNVVKSHDVRSRAEDFFQTCIGKPLDLSALKVEKHLLPLSCNSDDGHCGRWNSCIVPDRIIMHTTAGTRSAEDTYNYFANGSGGRGVGAHFVIGQDGKIYQLAELYPTMAEYTASVMNYPPQVSIEMGTTAQHQVYTSRDDAPPAQYQAALMLVQYLMKQYNIPVGNNDFYQIYPTDRGVYGHYQLDPLRKTDPGWGWMRDFHADLQRLTTSTPSTPSQP